MRTVSDTGEPLCSAGIARRLFRYALCACNDVQLNAAILIDSFDSRQGAYVPGQGQTGAAVGVNGAWSGPHSGTRLLGNLVVSGGGWLQLPADGFVLGGDLKTNAEILITAPGIRLARDLWADADIQLSGAGSFSVGRDLHQTPGHARPGGLMVGGGVYTENFVVAPPCACGDDDVLDIASIVAQAHAVNDNQAVNLQTTAFSNRLAGGGVAPAECGRFALDSVSLVGNLLFPIAGRTALFVKGDFSVSGSFGIDPGQTGELDVFVAGNLRIWSALAIGVAARPAAVRFYVAGDQTIIIPALAVFAAQLYAPNATVELSGAADTYGSVFARNIIAVTEQRVHFDRAIIEADDECDGQPLPACTGCNQCPGALACVQGRCGPCLNDADCCDPMACTNGQCQPLRL